MENVSNYQNCTTQIILEILVTIKSGFLLSGCFPLLPRTFSFSLAPCHGMASLPPLHPPLATSDPICLHSTPSTPTLLQLRSILVQLMQATSCPPSA